ncbi:MAG: RHS repeat-associated core domain-containing protein [Myxococcota bacterium]
MHYNRFRHYDPEIGRYISADPMEQEADPNRYRCALSNPATNIDPEGLVAFASAGAAGGSIGLGSGAGAGTIGSIGPPAPVVAAGVAGAIVGTTISERRVLPWTGRKIPCGLHERRWPLLRSIRLWITAWAVASGLTHSENLGQPQPVGLERGSP